MDSEAVCSKSDKRVPNLEQVASTKQTTNRSLGEQFQEEAIGDGSQLASAAYHRTTGVYCTTGRHCDYNSDCLFDNLTTTDYFGEHLQALSGNLVLRS
jgi:hypothetical protein